MTITSGTHVKVKVSVREAGYAMGMSMKGHPIGYNGKLYTVVSAHIDHKEKCGYLELEEVKGDGGQSGPESGGTQSASGGGIQGTGAAGTSTKQSP